MCSLILYIIVVAILSELNFTTSFDLQLIQS